MGIGYGKRSCKFTRRSVVQSIDEINNFIPPYPGWNYVEVDNHPLDSPYSFNYTGKWLLFVPNSDFVEIFRRLAKLTSAMKLTRTFKASGLNEDNKDHVFCVYCNSNDITFVRTIAETLDKEGYIEKYGYKYRNGSKAIFFKTDETTHYKSSAMGMSLTLFRFNTKKEFFVKVFNEKLPEWKLVDKNEKDVKIIDNFRSYLNSLYLQDDD